MATMRQGPAPVFQLKVTLRHSHPPIWRRVLVPAGTSLAELHDVLQVVMGWEDAHLHTFTVHGKDYGPRKMAQEMEVEDEGRIKLSQALRAPKDQLLYVYDMGDNWEHDVVLEKVLPPADVKDGLPQVTAGERAAPPEDVGGVWGYEDFLEAIRDPEHPEHEDYIDWVGGEFDPEAFDMKRINRELKQLRPRVRAGR